MLKTPPWAARWKNFTPVTLEQIRFAVTRSFPSWRREPVAEKETSDPSMFPACADEAEWEESSRPAPLTRLPGTHTGFERGGAEPVVEEVRGDEDWIAVDDDGVGFAPAAIACLDEQHAEKYMIRVLCSILKACPSSPRRQVPVVVTSRSAFLVADAGGVFTALHA